MNKLLAGMMVMVVTMGLALPATRAVAGVEDDLQVLQQQVANQQGQIDQLQNRLAQGAKAEGNDQKGLVPESLKALEGLNISLLGFAEYDSGKTGKTGNTQNSFNRFTLSRGYLTITKSVNPWLSARLTSDTHQTSDGYWEMYVKYAYGQVKLPDLGFLTGMKSEIGQGHTAWLDFEEGINSLRAQGSMVTDRGGFQTSADLGVDLIGGFGGKLDDAKGRVGNTHYDGLYGSWHIGVYNGSGYHGSEANQNKLVEARVTARPFGEILPGLQFSYMGAFGKGNTSAEPDFNLNLGMVSFQHPDFIVYGQYFVSKGNFMGSLVDTQGDALKADGYSFFGKYHLPVLQKKLSVFARYDHVNDDKDKVIADDADYSMYVGGLTYDLPKGNMILVDYEKVTYGDNSGGIGKVASIGNDVGDDQRLQVVYQFKF